MVKKAIKLKNDFKGVKGMVSQVQICINQKGEPMEDAKYDIVKGRPVITTNAFFDGGADGGGFDESIRDMIDSLESRTMAIGTAIGVDQKEYRRAKLQLIGNRFQNEIVHNMSAIGLKNIGTEKNNTEGYMDKLSELFGFNKAFKDHFQSQLAQGPQKIYAIIRQRSCSQMLVELTAEQLGTRHPWILPNVKIYANPLTNQILMAGHMGIESELVDADYPTFLVYNKTWEKMKKDFYGI